jgi:hypothetical protein
MITAHSDSSLNLPRQGKLTPDDESGASLARIATDRERVVVAHYVLRKVVIPENRGLIKENGELIRRWGRCGL